jgi:hypothetical protein
MMLTGRDDAFDVTAFAYDADSGVRRPRLVDLRGDTLLFNRIDSALVHGRLPYDFTTRASRAGPARGLGASLISYLGVGVGAIFRVPAIGTCGRFAADFLMARAAGET